MVWILRNKIEIEQELILETVCDEANSSDSKNSLNEDRVAAGYNNNVSGNQD
jgi:hypothetical protein